MGKKRLPRALAILIAFVIPFTDIFAQQVQKKTISGTFADQSNTPLANSTITVKVNKKVSATTDGCLRSVQDKTFYLDNVMPVK